MTTTVVAVMHDAHVACRVSFVAAVAARTAMVQAAVTKRARAATRAATRAEVRATTKVVRAAKVAVKEAAEKHASIVRAWTARCAARAAAKAANAPSVRAAKKEAAAVAKVVKAANALRLAAVRVARATAKVALVIKAAIVAIDKATARATMVVPATVCVAMHNAHVRVYHAHVKAAAKAANKVHAAVKAPRPTLNSAEVRERITARDRARAAGRAAQRAAEAALLAAMVHKHQATGLSLATIEARAAQGEAAKAANAARKAGMPAKVARPHVVIVRSGPTKNKGAKRVRVLRVHTVESIAANAARKAAIIKAKEDKEIAIVKAKEDAQIAKAKKWALRKEAYAARKAAMEVIASDAWMLKGVWLSEDLIRAANDWSYQVRIAAFKEARAIAYPPKTKAVATTGVAA